MGSPLSDFRDELQTLSRTISDQVRSIALGLIALVWALLTGMKDSGINIDVRDRRELLLVALVAVVAMLVDYLQYLSGYLNTQRILRSAEQKDKKEAAYNSRAPLYRARVACFGLKQVVVLFAAGWMGAILIRIVARP